MAAIALAMVVDGPTLRVPLINMVNLLSSSVADWVKRGMTRPCALVAAPRLRRMLA
jgi:hypothetical protein